MRITISAATEADYAQPLSVSQSAGQEAQSTLQAPDRSAPAKLDPDAGTGPPRLTTCHTFILRMEPLAEGQDPPCLIQIEDDNGEVLVSGAGESTVDALLEVVLHLLPRDHPERPNPAPKAPDDE